MSVAEKELIISANNVIIAENEQRVFNAGQLSVISNAEALKGSASGSSVTIKDISPVEHDVSVKLSGLYTLTGEVIDIPKPYPFVAEGYNTPNATIDVTSDGTITIDNNYTDSLGPLYIAKNLVLPAGTYTLSGWAVEENTYEGVDDLSGAMFAETIGVYKSDVFGGNGDFSNDRIGEVSIIEESPTGFIKDLTFTLIEETPIYIIYLYGSAPAGMNHVPTRVITKLKPTLLQNASQEAYDYSSVKVQRLGKNLFNGELKIWRKADRIMPKECIKVKPNTWYKITVYDYTIKAPTFAFYGNNTGVICDDGINTDTVIASMTTAFNSGSYEYIWFRQWSTMTEDGITLDCRVQIEEVEGQQSPATEYEPYIEPTEHTANSDGTVEGIKSLYPTTTLITDTQGVIITAQYIKDIDKAFEERLAALEAAIVNNE